MSRNRGFAPGIIKPAGGPVASADDFGAVISNDDSKSDLDAVANDTYEGTKDDLVVAITQQGSLGTWSVDADNNLRYAAGGSTGTDTNGRYTIQDATGTSAPAQLTIDVVVADGGTGGGNNVTARLGSTTVTTRFGATIVTTRSL